MFNLRKFLGQFVEQPEPTVDGDCFVVEMDALKDRGVSMVEFHYDEDGKLNDVHFYTAAGEWIL